MTFSISAKKRAGQNLTEVRASGEIPGVVYGGDRKETTPVSVSLSAFTKVYNEAGSSLIDLTVAGEPAVKVLVQDVQFEPVKSIPTHVDFRQINMNKEMTAMVELVFSGEAPAVKELGGTFAMSVNEVEITCLPKDMVSQIEISIAGLKTFDDAIRIKDIVVPAGIVINEDAERVLAKVTPPLSEEELKAMEAPVAVDLTAIEVEKKGKKDEEGAEGAEPAK